MKIYFIKCAVNDKGFHSGMHYFTKLEDCIKHMRSYVARQLMYARWNGKTSDIVEVSDRLMSDGSADMNTYYKSLWVKIDNDTFDYRIWCENVHEGPINESINF